MTEPSPESLKKAEEIVDQFLRCRERVSSGAPRQANGRQSFELALVGRWLSAVVDEAVHA